jgi:hypothetical protein
VGLGYLAYLSEKGNEFAERLKSGLVERAKKREYHQFT